MSVVGDDDRLEVLFNGNDVVHIANLDVTEDAHDGRVDLFHAHDDMIQLNSTQVEKYHDDGMNHLHDVHLMNEDADDHPYSSSEMNHQLHPSWHDYFLEIQSLASRGVVDIQPGTHPALEQWISEQRLMYQEMKKGHETALTNERRVLLDAIGFRWESQIEKYSLSLLDSAVNDEGVFQSRCAELLTFRDIHGHSNVPFGYKDNPELGEWVCFIREIFSKKLLSEENCNVLKQLGFEFVVPGQNASTTFEERVEQIKSFKGLYGHTKIPMGWSVDPSLHDWILEQKALLQICMSGQECDLSDDLKRTILDLDIDFDYYASSSHVSFLKDPDHDLGRSQDMNRSSQWDAMYQELREYRIIHGHTNVPRRSKRDPSKDALGEWVHFQKRQHRNLFTGKNSTLTLARKKALDVIEFQWEKSSSTYCTDINAAIDMIIQKTPDKLYNEQWYERLQQLRGYMERYQTSHVDFNLNPVLALWTKKQRSYYHAWKQNLGSDHLHDRRFDHDKYHSLLAIQFDFEEPQDFGFIPKDYRVISDDPDYIEIFGGIEDDPSSLPQLHDAQDHYNYISSHDLMSPQDNNFSKLPQSNNHSQATELNESDVHMILVGDRDEDRIHDDHDISHQVPMPNVGGNDEADAMDQENDQDNDLLHHNHHFPQEQLVALEMSPDNNINPPLQSKPSNTNQRRVMIKVRVDWEERVLELIQYKNRKHHTEVKQKTHPELADWSQRQKLQYLRFIRKQPSSLTIRRIEILSDLGFNFFSHDIEYSSLQNDDSQILLDLTAYSSSKLSKNRSMGSNGRFKEAKWLESLSKVVRFKERFGHCNVPRKWKDDHTLGEWVHFQRRLYRLRNLGKRTHLSDERVQKLNAIGFEWSRVSHNGSSFVPHGGIITSHGPSISNTNNEGQKDHGEYEYGVPSEVSHLVLDDQERAAAEIAAVVAEHLNHTTNHHLHDDHEEEEEDEKKHIAVAHVQV